MFDEIINVILNFYSSIGTSIGFIGHMQWSHYGGLYPFRLTKELRSIIKSFLKYLIFARNLSQSSILYVSQTVGDSQSFRVRFKYFAVRFFSPSEIKLFCWISYQISIRVVLN